MCGICGFTGATSSDMPIIQRMCDVMAHRGPDGEGQYLDVESGIALGHRRLSLIDLEGGNQPMIRADAAPVSRITSPARTPGGSWREGSERAACIGRFAVVYNGEIYNYRQLRSELEAQGWTFQTDSDTEVLLLGYLAWGEDVLNRLRGMFAFAIWDKESRELFCARDFFGIKPFYYTVQPSAQQAGQSADQVVADGSYAAQQAGQSADQVAADDPSADGRAAAGTSAPDEDSWGGASKQYAA